MRPDLAVPPAGLVGRSGLTSARVAFRVRSDVLAATLAVGLLAIAVLGLSIPGGRAARIAESPAASQTAVSPPAAAAVPQGTPGVSPQAERRAADSYGKLPLSFVRNEGQTDKSVRFLAQSAGHSFYFTPDKAVLSFSGEKRGVALHLTPLDASPDTKLSASDRLPGKVNYLTGSERRTNISTYREITYRSVWPGIDMVFRGQGAALKYEFRLRPGADPRRIALAYRGAEGLSLGPAGNLLISTPLGTLRDSRPRSFQRVEGRRVPVGSRYTLRGGDTYGFALGASYDPGRPLVIDPGLVYSTFLGGSSFESVSGIAIDGSGNAYVAGTSGSSDYPTTPGAFDRTSGSGPVVTKLNAAGSDLVYSTFLGGVTGGGSGASHIEVDGSGNAYVAGHTHSPDLITTVGAFDRSYNGGGDHFVAKLNAAGSDLVYSTYVGGALGEGELDFALDGAGNAYLAGLTVSTDFPTTPGALDRTFNGDRDAFVAKLNAAGSDLDYGTYLGGFSDDFAAGIAVDGAGSAYVTGRTQSSGSESEDFPTTPGAWDRSFNGIEDAFVTKLDPNGSALAYSTFLGGSGAEMGDAIAVDGAGGAYVTGFAWSSDFPTTPGAYDRAVSFKDAFITKLNATGSALAYSTYLGGSSLEEGERGWGIAVDGAGSAYVVGETDSVDFPTTEDAFDRSFNGGQRDTVVTRLNDTGTALAYSTYLGGDSLDQGFRIAVDSSGNAYVAGRTGSSNFPIANALDGDLSGPEDAFVTKLSLFVDSVSESVPPGGTASTNQDATPGDPLGTSVTSPNGGTVSITEQPENSSLPGGFSGLGWRVQVTAPVATAANPLVLVFRVDASLLPNPLLGPVAIFKNGVRIPWCANPASNIADPDPCIKDEHLLPNGDGEATVLSSSASTWDLAVEAPPPHPTPSAASSLDVSLVPVFRETLSASQCAARGGAQSEHGAPELAPPAGPDLSCNPPGYVPGTAARLGPEALGTASLARVPGDPMTPADEADLGLALNATDIRAIVGGGDYAPNAGGADVTLIAKLRISDTYNGPSLTTSATVIDSDLRVPVDCAPTGGPEGSTCDVATSADALQLGTIREGTDMVLQTFRPRVNDSGANGVRGDSDDRFFATQGMYVP